MIIEQVQELNGKIKRINEHTNVAQGRAEAARNAYDKAVFAYKERFGVQIDDTNIQQEYNKLLAKAQEEFNNVNSLVTRIESGEYQQEMLEKQRIEREKSIALANQQEQQERQAEADRRAQEQLMKEQEAQNAQLTSTNPFEQTHQEQPSQPTQPAPTYEPVNTGSTPNAIPEFPAVFGEVTQPQTNVEPTAPNKPTEEGLPKSAISPIDLASALASSQGQQVTAHNPFEQEDKKDAPVSELQKEEEVKPEQEKVEPLTWGNPDAINANFNSILGNNQ